MDTPKLDGVAENGSEIPKTHTYKNAQGKANTEMHPAWFTQYAESQMINVLGEDFQLNVHENGETGSCGWNANGKKTITINGVQGRVQVSINLTLIGSKNAK